MRTHGIGFGGLTLLAFAAAAANNEIGVDYGHSTLSDDLPDWNETRLHWTHARDKQYSWELSLQQLRRFREDDTQLGAGGSLALGEHWSLNGEAAATVNADVLPRQSLELGLSRMFGENWLLAGAASTARYPGDTVYGGELSMEWLPKPWRLVYGLIYGRLQGAGDGYSQLLQGEYIYGDGSLGIGVITGDQVDRIDPGQVVIADASAMFLEGRHWLSPRWGFDYRFAHYKHEVFYDRNELRLGLIMRF